MAFAKPGESDEVMSEINVTPLVDVMLVLVVVFLVTAPLLTNHIRVNLPQTAKTVLPEQQKRSVNLSIAPGAKLYLDRREIALTAVEPELRALKSLHPELVVHLNADKATPFDLVAKTMSAVDRAGIVRLSVLTVSE